MFTTKTLETLDKEGLSHLTKYADGLDQDTPFILVGMYYLPQDDAADILKEQLAPSLVEAFYDRRITIAQANKKLHSIEILYPNKYNRYYASSNLRDYI